MSIVAPPPPASDTPIVALRTHLAAASVSDDGTSLSLGNGVTLPVTAMTPHGPILSVYLLASHRNDGLAAYGKACMKYKVKMVRTDERSAALLALGLVPPEGTGGDAQPSGGGTAAPKRSDPASSSKSGRPAEKRDRDRDRDRHRDRDRDRSKSRDKRHKKPPPPSSKAEGAPSSSGPVSNETIIGNLMNIAGRRGEGAKKKEAFPAAATPAPAAPAPVTDDDGEADDELRRRRRASLTASLTTASVSAA
eukprot:CAMPEP_0194266762 /NCGR_PEP_ID=MMETSP0169-20130528/1560_1 /TAXON_ID=218684 /ORGANISM="Corethron pennatum, Strain L29A3" /LENGTH=249 /DNA_ID=CAMNT_0039007521 /DNA_START=89 /DNA_END=835 /DNA_ORIENTATION=+